MIPTNGEYNTIIIDLGDGRTCAGEGDIQGWSRTAKARPLGQGGSRSGSLEEISGHVFRQKGETMLFDSFGFKESPNIFPVE